MHPSVVLRAALRKIHADRNTSYGALRWELLQFCIDQLENGHV